jgi:dCTP deaminase
MVLSDIEINKEMKSGRLKIYGENIYVGPSSIDFHLSGSGKVLKLEDSRILDCKSDNSNLFEEIDFTELHGIDIIPGSFWIMSTTERVVLPNDIAGFIQGRSSLARLGIQVHCAGFADPGFDGTITLEVSNMTQKSIRMYANMRICQIVFVRTGKPASVGYSQKKDQKYNKQEGPQLSKIHEDKS